MIQTKNKEILIQCECHDHILGLEQDEYFLYLTVYNCYNKGIWQRIKCAWLTLFKGHYLNCDVVLNAEDVNKLQFFLQEIKLKK